MSRELSDKDIAELPCIISGDEGIKKSLPLLESLGNELARLYKLQEASDLLDNTGWTEVTRRNMPSAHFSPLMQEFIRFIEVSAGSCSDLRPDETSFWFQQQANPETFSCFREHNETHRRILSSLKVDSCSEEPFFLSRWMMWRLYAWGLPEVQNALQPNITCAQDVFERRLQVERRFGKRPIMVNTYGLHYNIPSDVKSMEKIWNHGVEIWSKWRMRLPISFSEAQQAISGKGIPVYSAGRLSQLLLYGDLSTLGIIVSPTASEMAKLIIQAKSGALDGLKILGYDCSVDVVEAAISLLCDVVDKHIDSNAKLLFHEGKATAFDIEHILCKVSIKQSQRATKSPVWSGVSQRKRMSEDVVDSKTYVQNKKKCKLN